MAKSKIKEAVAAARRESEDQELKPLVNKIVAGVAKIINAEIQQNPDRTDELLNAIGIFASKLEAQVAAAADKEIVFPDFPVPESVDLGGLEQRLVRIERDLAVVAAKKNVAWVFEHKKDSRGRPSETIARPQNGAD